MALATLARSVSLLVTPVSREKRALHERRFRELPAELQVPWQVVGQQLVHCGYTLGAPYCSFGCTHCYLPRNANRAPLPSLAEMKAQVDHNRAALGPVGALQITGGDVVDAYLRAGRPGELVEVVRYATERRLEPMVMTHGQGLLDHPELLRDLVVRGRLRRLAVHIDTTQAGRPGYPLAGLRRERDLDPLRRSFVDLILGTARATGRALRAAHTVTVTERNRDSIGDIVRFQLEDPRHLRAFSMLSFQTEAAVGRTRFSARPASADDTWRALGEALGVALAHQGMYWFGHPACSRMVPLMVLFPERRVVALAGDDAQSRELVSQVLRTLGGMGRRGPSAAEAAAQRLALLVRRPRVAATGLRHLRRLLRRERLPAAGLLGRLVQGRLGFFSLVQHNFMSAEQVRHPDAEAAARLRACSFRGAVERSDGSVESVPMCAMNAIEREDRYTLEIGRGRGDGSGAAQSGGSLPRGTTALR